MKHRTIRACAAALVVSTLSFGAVSSAPTAGQNDRSSSSVVQESSNAEVGHVAAAGRKWWK